MFVTLLLFTRTLACKLTNLLLVPSTYTGSLSSFVYLDSTSTSPNSTATLSVCTCACASSLNYMYLRSQMIRISEHLVWTTSTCCSSYKHTHIYGEFKRGPGWVSLAGFGWGFIHALPRFIWHQAQRRPSARTAHEDERTGALVADL